MQERGSYRDRERERECLWPRSRVAPPLAVIIVNSKSLLRFAFVRTGQERQVHQCVSIMWFIHTYALSSNICYYNNYDKCGKFKNASQRTARKTHIHIQQKPVRGVKRGMHVCVCVQKAQQIVHKKQLNFEIQVQGQMTTVF